MHCIGGLFSWMARPVAVEEWLGEDANMYFCRFFIIFSLLYGAIFFKGQTEGTIRLRTDEPIGLDTDGSTANDEAIARELQANEPEWEA